MDKVSPSLAPVQQQRVHRCDPAVVPEALEEAQQIQRTRGGTWIRVVLGQDLVVVAGRDVER